MDRTEGESIVRKLIAVNDIRIPLSSWYQKGKKTEETYALGIKNYVAQKADFGNSVTVKIREEERLKTRGMTEGIEDFCKEYPTEGKILKAKIEAKRAEREVHLDYGLKEGCRISEGDYLTVLKDLGFSDEQANSAYPTLMEVTRKLQETKRSRLKTKDGLRSIVVE